MPPRSRKQIGPIGRLCRLLGFGTNKFLTTFGLSSVRPRRDTESKRFLFKAFNLQAYLGAIDWVLPKTAA